MQTFVTPSEPHRRPLVEAIKGTGLQNSVSEICSPLWIHASPLDYASLEVYVVADRHLHAGPVHWRHPFQVVGHVDDTLIVRVGVEVSSVLLRGGYG